MLRKKTQQFKIAQKVSLPDIQQPGAFPKRLQRLAKSRVSIKLPEATRVRSSRSAISMFSYKSIMTNPEDNKAFMESLETNDEDSSEEKHFNNLRTKDTMYNVLDFPEREEILEKLYFINESEKVISTTSIKKSSEQEYINDYMCSIAKKCASPKSSAEAESLVKLDQLHFRDFCGTLAKELISSINTVLIAFEVLKNDCCLETGAMYLVDILTSMNKEVLVIHTGDDMSRSSIHQWLWERNIRSVDKDHIICTSYVTACIIKDLMNFQGKMLCCGSKELNDELLEEGINSVLLEDEENKALFHCITTFNPDPEISLVLMGFDENFTYNKGFRFVNYLSKSDMPFLVTNLYDEHPGDPRSTKSELRCMYTFVSAAAEKEADYILGLPEEHTQKVLASVSDINPDLTLYIGQRMMPDMLLANTSGYHSIMVNVNEEIKSQMMKSHDVNVLEDACYCPEFVCKSVLELGMLIKGIFAETSQRI